MVLDHLLFLVEYMPCEVAVKSRVKSRLKTEGPLTNNEREEKSVRKFLSFRAALPIVLASLCEPKSLLNPTLSDHGCCLTLPICNPMFGIHLQLPKVLVTKTGQTQ